jgi:SAM-dependent methyltransferase
MEGAHPRLAAEQLIVDLLPPGPRRVLDLGCGDGRLAALVVGARESVTGAVLVDSSPAMLERARARFAGDERFRIVAGDLADGIRDHGEADVIVSGLAIHHLEDDGKRALLGQVAEQLRPGGVFANLDVIESATPELHDEFLRAMKRTGNDPEDRLAPIEPQLQWMRAAGLAQVDCLWRWRGLALLVGQRPA